MPLAISHRTGSFVGALSTLLLALSLNAQPPLEPDDEKPLPDIQNAQYGPHERNVLDLWKAKSSKPTPLLIFFHGGGFVGGDKRNLNADLLDRCLKAGISVASANYRFSRHAPYPAPMLDGARAIQFLRFKAKEFNLDPKRFAASGSSAGAGITLWIGYHNDLRDRKSDDPILRESTRVSCMGVWGAQTSYDPRFIKKYIGGRAYEHPSLIAFFGVTREDLDSPRAYHLYQSAGSINYVSKDDPPVFMYYVEPREPLPPSPNTTDKLDYPQFQEPIEGQPKPGAGIHHPQFGILLKEKLDLLKIECILRHRDDFRDKGVAQGEYENEANKEFVDLLVRLVARKSK